jgi:hypothetical protein
MFPSPATRPSLLSPNRTGSVSTEISDTRDPSHGEPTLPSSPAVVDDDLARRNASAAKRGRRHLENLMVATKTAAHVCDGAASTLSYSAAALSDPSLYERSMTSGAAWSASAAFNIMNHAASDQKNSVVSLLSHTANFGAGVASMATTGLNNIAHPHQATVNSAAISSNGLWGVAGLLTTASAILPGRKTAGGHAASALTYTATGLRVAGGLANTAAAGVSIGSTILSNGNNSTLNKVSSGLWVAGTVLDTMSTVLDKVGESNQTQDVNRTISAGDEMV